MWRNWEAIWLVARREFRDQFRDWRILTPMILLVSLFPFVADDMTRRAVEFMNRNGGQIILDRLIPFAVLVIGFFPLSFTLLVALESFVGEKERGTIEPMLSSPLDDAQMYLGKLLVGVATPLMFSFGSVSIYLILMLRRGLSMPNPYLLLLILFLTIAHAVLMVSSAIVISIQATSVRAANLMASFVIVPVSLVLQGETTLIFWGNEDVLWFAIVAVLIMTGLIIRLGLSHFKREYMLGREIDTVNLRWIWRTFMARFIGGAKSLREWYLVELPKTLREILMATRIALLLAVFALAASYTWVIIKVPQMITLTPDRIEKIQDTVLKGLPALSTFGNRMPVPVLFWNNTRATLTIFLAGMVSFGTLGLAAYLGNMALVGGVLGLGQLAGIPPWIAFGAGILPHGIFELTAIIISTAAMLKAGAMLVTPQTEKSLGEILLISIADWLKIFIGITLPLLAVAAIIEINVTPRLLQYALSSILLR